MNSIKRSIVSVLMLLVLVLGIGSAADGAVDQTTVPQQIAVAMTAEPTTSVNINWTTIDTSLTNPVVLVWKGTEAESTATRIEAQVETRNVTNSTIKDGENQAITAKNFYTAAITKLQPNTEYKYRVGVENAMSEIAAFTTAQDNNDGYTFIYFADSQVSGNHAKGWNANLDIVKDMFPASKFLFIAGDLTDKASNEGQWESFFNQIGNEQYNEKYAGSLISELPLAAIMGNHDSADAGIGGMNSHYAFDSEVEGVPDTYTFDYGAAHFIMLNLENAYSRDNATAKEAQTRFLTDEVAKAKAAGQWVIVGFHKAIYSGANHMDDSDVIFNRKYWGPIFADLDVDVVLQGHDHVLSRGFIKADGTKADVTEKVASRTFKAEAPDNAPLYYEGNTASTLKFYAPILSNDWIQADDPVAPNFGYLDINSALPAGYLSLFDGKLLNPGPSTNDDLEGVDPTFFRTPTFTAITVTEGSLQFKTYMTGFDSNTNSVVQYTFLYDSLKVTRDTTSIELAAAKTAAKDELNSTLSSYDQGDYSERNWTALNKAKTDGDAAIEAAADMNAVASAKNAAIAAMAAVKKINTATYTDVNSDSWYYSHVTFVTQENIFNGTTPTTFAPEQSITRAQFVTILGRYAGIADTNPGTPVEGAFEDVDKGGYYAAHVVWAVEQGIVNGTSPKTFSPEEKISRQDMATMIYRFAKAANIQLPDTGSVAAFGDDSKIANYAKDAVYAMKKAGIIDGRGDNLFVPADTATRAEAAAIMHRLIQLAIVS